MSASREKNKRKEQTASPETAKETKKGMSKGLKTTLIAVCAVLIVCIVVFFYMLTSGFFAGHTTAATVGSHNLSPAMVNYFYKSAYTSLQNTWSASTNSRPSCRASIVPIVVLPLPGIPIMMIFCMRAAREAVISVIRLSGTGCPVKSSQLFFACAVSIRRPLAHGIPSRSACRRNSVRAGL